MPIQSSLLILALCIQWLIVPAAHADVYVYGDTYANASGEIRLSNFPADSGYHLLIEENSPVAAAAPARSTTAPALSRNVLPFDDVVHAAAVETSLDPALLHAVIAAESHHDAHARSRRGAQGLMQLMPAIVRRFQVSDPYDPAQNIRAGARYLRELRDLYKGDLSLALAAYNAGTDAVDRFGGRVPPFKETRRYVPKVMQLYRRLSSRQM
jgi:soluble lytic murein transglycosylase-like protein